jgi:di/tricarboxylate transporter
VDSTKEDNQKILIANSKSKNQNRTNISKGNFFKQFIKLSFIILIVFGLYLLFFGKSTAEEVDESVKIENWVSKKEWVTFVKEDNVNNSFIRTFLNNSLLN